MATTYAQGQVELADVALMDEQWFADGPPHELFERMCAEAPVRCQCASRRQRARACC